MLIVGAKQLILKNQLRRHIVSTTDALSQVCNSHGVSVIFLIVVEDTRTALQHRIVSISILTCDRILLVDTHVRHLLASEVQQTLIVLMVLLV